MIDLKNFKSYLNKTESPYGLSAFRIILGSLSFISLFRYIYFGWVEKFFYKPSVHLKYPGFSWVESLPSPYMDYFLYGLMILSFLFVIGWKYRLVAPSLFIGFLYVHLIDQSLYLNHYYLVSLLLFIMIFLPADAALNIFKKNRVEVRNWHYSLLRFQIGAVYFFAGLAKLTRDWLFEAQPMNLWLGNLVDMPLIGGLLDEIFVQYIFAWSGFLYDLSIPFWLLWSRSRPYAFCVVIVFHTFTSLFFPIGLFPYIMTFCALIFFKPDWPLKIFKIDNEKEKSLKVLSPEFKGIRVFLVSLYVFLQVSLPLRHFLYPGNVLWTEEGMRFSWKVMVREKNGSVTFRVRDSDTGVEWFEESHNYLEDYQVAEMSGIPDMILQMAHVIGKKYKKEGRKVEVFVDSKASLNGRKFVQMIDPKVNLLEKKYSLKAFDFILPEPKTKPFKIKPLRKGL